MRKGVDVDEELEDRVAALESRVAKLEDKPVMKRGPSPYDAGASRSQSCNRGPRKGSRYCACGCGYKYLPGECRN